MVRGNAARLVVKALALTSFWPALLLTTAAQVLFSISATIAGEVDVVLVAEGFEMPSNFTTPGGGDPRILVLERELGKVRTILDGNILAEPFLDIGDRIHVEESEDGLVGIAFPPNFRESGHVYLAYSPDDSSIVLSRFDLNESTQKADTESESIIIRIERFGPWHLCGHIAFNPLDGFLYMCVGDTDLQGNPRGTAQDLGTLQGSILRTDVESAADAYSIPSDNPFVSVKDARPEIWAYGLRNPWRFSIDSISGDIFIPDIGWDAWEEINVRSAKSEAGSNFGWNLAQGNECRLDCEGQSIIWPLVEIPHVGNVCAVTGGMVYRGLEYPAWYGVYIFSDFCSGTIWALRDHQGVAQIQELGESSINPTAIGPGPMGEIMATDYGRGALYRIVLPDHVESDWQNLTTYLSRTILDARREGNGELKRVFSSKTWQIAQGLKAVYNFLRLDRIYN